jgi:hypothetical protein
MKSNPINEGKGKKGAYEIWEKFRLTRQILVNTLVVMLLFFTACNKKNLGESPNSTAGIPIAKQQQSSIDSLINSIYELKKDLALQFNNREKIVVNDIFYSDEVKKAVLYKFLTLAEMGIIKQYSHDVKILNNEGFISTTGNVVIPGLEKVQSVSIAPNGNEKIESAYTDKLFFSFAKKDGQWKLTGIEILLPNYGTDTKYSGDVVVNYVLTASDMELQSKISEDLRVLYEERKIFEKFFDKKIDEKNLGNQLYILYETYNLIPKPDQEGLQRQGNLNKNNVANYASQWTDNTGSTTSTVSYNNAMYKAYNPNDCANYASQSLRTGGWQNETPYTNWNLWWYNNKNTSTTIDDSGSNIWVGADALFHYIVPTYASSKSISQAHAGGVAKADLLWLANSSTAAKYHVMVVTNTSWLSPSNYTNIYLSAHTSNRKNYNVQNIGSSINQIFGHFQ